MKKELRIVSPNGHLGFAPTKEGSFKIAAATKPDYYCADSGSDDIGPTALGSDRSVSMYNWQKHDLELMLLAAREQGVPMIIGSAGDTGANSRVDMYVQIIKDLAKEHNLPPFKIGYFYSEVEKEFLKNQMQNDVKIEGLDSRNDLTLEELENTKRIVAVAGVHPFIKALDLGADVVIGGRSSDVAVFAAPAIREGFPEANAYYLGKVLECASFCAEPYGAKESIIGTITHEDVKATAMHPDQRCTIASVAGHAMYERSNPYFEYFAGGMLDMTDCHYEQYDEKTCRITGYKYKPIEGKVKVKLEGAGLIGEKFIGIAGVRDPYTIENIDTVIKFVEDQVAQEFAGVEYSLNLKVFGKNGVMGDLEPVKEIKSHELAIVIEGITRDKVTAEELTLFATRQVFYCKLPEVKGTAGTAAYLIDDVLYAGQSYKWTLNHVIPVENALDLFDVRVEEVTSEQKNKVLN
ncbi:acyclic terpene utilization AtuA family protein [Solibacillus sp. FSL W7-1436]|uniref:acyclic terpene utilization AtuA family protein n=1 Tax=Solibacillus sp. FSL W7-1436 TaxID=2921705 RepID=UPI0030F4DFFF